MMHTKTAAPETTPQHEARRGFTLMEVLVALSILTVVLVAALVLLDTTNRVTRTQIARADIQQSVRIAQDEMSRKLRTAGRGGLLAETGTLGLPNAVSLEVANNVGSGQTIFPSDGTSPAVLEGSDVLTVRGAFDNPLYYLDPLDSDLYSFNTAAGTGVVTIPRGTPDGNFVQDLELLDEMRAANRPGEAVVIVSPFDDDIYGVASINWGGSSLDTTDDEFNLAFQFQDDPTVINAANPGSAVDAASVLSSNGAFPTELYRSGFKTISVLQEYRFFIRDATVSGTSGGRFAPKLSMVRTQINQDAYWQDDPLTPDTEPWEDIADYIIDLQVALGFITNPDLGEVVESADGTGDDWYLNAIGDTVPVGDLALIRVTTLARSATPSRATESRVLLSLEDRTYTTSDINEPTERAYRRFFMPTVISLRNL